MLPEPALEDPDREPELDPEDPDRVGPEPLEEPEDEEPRLIDPDPDRDEEDDDPRLTVPDREEEDDVRLSSEIRLRLEELLLILRTAELTADPDRSDSVLLPRMAGEDG